MINKVEVNCSGCNTVTKLDLVNGTATLTVPSNGKRGRLHVPAHQAVATVWYTDGTDLAMWECPLCGYADSWVEYDD
jgi:hypothetical protein